MRDADLEQLIAAWLDGRISESDSERLQQQLRQSAEARSTFREFASLDTVLRDIASGDTESSSGMSIIPDQADRDTDPVTEKAQPNPGRHNPGRHNPGRLDLWNHGSATWIQLACAAVVLIMVGGIAYQFGKVETGRPPVSISAEYRPERVAEQTIAGYATLRRGTGIQWTEGASSYREGDVLPAGVLEFQDGIAEIDFFCGAALIVEGPAKLDLESDWSVRLVAGRLRANVPPAARGFVVKAADSEIIDLGTEFALDVGPDNVRVEVVEGEVELRGGEHDGDHLITGEGLSLFGNNPGAGASFLKSFSKVGDVQRRHAAARRERFDRWKTHSQQLRSDQRLIAYYPIAESEDTRFVPNVASTGRELDGTLVGLVNRADGRFGPESGGLEFDRPGARVRARIDGQFQAFTFACWAKIDSLEHRYNALFMGDGYDTGEPHWQIRDDGRLMFSVMVDDTQKISRFDKTDQRIVATGGLHHIYFTEPCWDISKSGQWFHLAAVYDPEGRMVVQYVNGKQISREAIAEKFHIDTLRIGPAEIGNWGQPLRKTPWFSVRNLNGTIDELAIFNAALRSDEIQDFYEQGKPLGY